MNLLFMFPGYEVGYNIIIGPHCFLQLLLSMHCSPFHISNKPDQQQPKYIKRHCLEDNELKRLGLVLENCEDSVGRHGWELEQAEAKW